MDLHRFFTHLGAHSFISKALSKLQTRYPTSVTARERMKLIRGMVLLLIAILMGWLSLESSIQNGKELFSREHTLPPLAWKASLTHFHLEAQNNLEPFSSLLKTHPDPYSNSSEIWANENGCAVYLAKSPHALDSQKSPGPELWVCPEKLTSQKWVNLGTGIIGFERLLAFLEKYQPKIESKHALIRNLIDPKEIRY